MQIIQEESWPSPWFVKLIRASVGGRNYAAEAVYELAEQGAVGWFTGRRSHGGRPFYGNAEYVGYVHVAHAIRTDVRINTYDELRTITGVLRALARKGHTYTNEQGKEQMVWGWTDFGFIRSLPRKDIEAVLKDVPKWRGLTLSQLEEALEKHYFSSCSTDA